MAVARLGMAEELDLHPRHVDAGRAVALAALAADAEVHGLVHRLAGEGIGAELAGQRQTQAVGAAARQMLLVASDAIARAHGAGVELAAMTVVVAHLDGLGEARSEEHTSELQSLMRNSYAVFCLKKKKKELINKCLCD